MFNKKVTKEEFYEQIRRTNANFDKLHDKLDKLAKALGYEWKSKAEKRITEHYWGCDEEAILVWDWEKNGQDESVEDTGTPFRASRILVDHAARWGDLCEYWNENLAKSLKKTILNKPKRKYTKRKVAKKK